MRSVKYLQQAKDKLGVSSDAQLALKLKLSKGAVSHYLNGRRVMDDETCLAIALVLNIDPMEIIGAACMDRAEQSGQHSLWEVFMQRGAMAASAVLALAVTFSVTPSSAEAAQLTDVSKPGGLDTSYYVKCDVGGARCVQAACALRCPFLKTDLQFGRHAGGVAGARPLGGAAARFDDLA